MDVYHDLMQKAITYDNVAIVSVKLNDYKIHFWYDANLSENSGSLQKHKKLIFLAIYKK